MGRKRRVKNSWREDFFDKKQKFDPDATSIKFLIDGDTDLDSTLATMIDNTNQQVYIIEGFNKSIEYVIKLAEDYKRHFRDNNTTCIEQSTEILMFDDKPKISITLLKNQKVDQ